MEQALDDLFRFHLSTPSIGPELQWHFFGDQPKMPIKRKQWHFTPHGLLRDDQVWNADLVDPVGKTDDLHGTNILPIDFHI